MKLLGLGLTKSALRLLHDLVLGLLSLSNVGLVFLCDLLALLANEIFEVGVDLLNLLSVLVLVVAKESTRREGSRLKRE